MYKFQNLNQALIGLSRSLLDYGVPRKTRGFDCIEMPEPVLITIENPCDRYVTIKERKWNKILPFVESLWLALGINDLDELPGNYVKSLYDFSDDGRTWRAGYGPRMRAFSGILNDYNVSEAKYRNIFSGLVGPVDQYKFVIDSIKRDINTRQALITIADPAKDCFDLKDNLKITKDQPCTRSLHFQVNTEGNLDMIVEIRSNDILWGFSAVNVFNFTLIQEYIANILGLKVGRYFHIAHNIHFYENFRDKITYFANLNPEDYKSLSPFYYQDKIESLENFDSLVDGLFTYEKMLRLEKIFYLPNMNNDMFNDWGLILYNYHTKKEVNFINPYLNRLFYESRDL